MFFGWLRNQVKAAVLGGIEDAAAELGTGTDPAEVARLLRQRLDALPAPAPEAPPPPDESAHTNGRRGKARV